MTALLHILKTNHLCFASRLIFVCILMTLAGTTLAARKVETVYYSIYGSSYEELSQQMAQKGPRGFSAYTSSSLKYNYRTTSAGSACRIAQINVDYVLTYTMPQWEAPDSAPPALIDWWGKFYTALLSHEENHGRIADQRYSAIRTKLSSLGTRPSCAEFGPLLTQEYNVISQEFAAKQAEYDRLTQHGRTEMPSFYSGNQSNAGANIAETSISAFLRQNWIWLVLGGTIVVLAIRH